VTLWITQPRADRVHFCFALRPSQELWVSVGAPPRQGMALRGFAQHPGFATTAMITLDPAAGANAMAHMQLVGGGRAAPNP